MHIGVKHQQHPLSFTHASEWFSVSIRETVASNVSKRSEPIFWRCPARKCRVCLYQAQRIIKKLSSEQVLSITSIDFSTPFHKLGIRPWLRQRCLWRFMLDFSRDLPTAPFFDISQPVLFLATNDLYGSQHSLFLSCLRLIHSRSRLTTVSSRLIPTGTARNTLHYSNNLANLKFFSNFCFMGH